MQDLASIPDKDIYHEAVSRLNAARDFCNQIGLENVGALTGSSTPPPAPATAQRAARTSSTAKPAARSGQRQASTRNTGALSADNQAALQAQIHDARTGKKTFRAQGLKDWTPGKTASPANAPKAWRQHFAQGGRAELV